MSEAAEIYQTDNRSIKKEIDEIKRREILNEAVRQFYKNGYDATTVESISGALGVTKPYVYARFKSKIDMLVAICRQGAAPAQAASEYAKTQSGGPAEKLSALIEHFVALQIANRMEVSLYFREAKALPADELISIDKSRLAFHRALCGVLEEGKRADVFIIKDVPLAASAIGGMASWTFTWFQPEGRRGSSSIAREIATLALNTAGATSTGSGGETAQS